MLGKVAPFLDDVEPACPQDARENDGQREVVDVVGRQAEQVRTPRRKCDRDDEPDDQQDPIGLNGKIADLKKGRVHADSIISGQHLTVCLDSRGGQRVDSCRLIPLDFPTTMMTDELQAPTPDADATASAGATTSDATAAATADPIVATVEAPATPETPAEAPAEAPTPTETASAPVEAVAEAPVATAPIAEPTPAPVAPVAPAAPAASLTPEDDMALFEAEMASLAAGPGRGAETSYKKLTKGDRIEATVIQVEKERVFVDLGTKSEGVVPLAELSVDTLETAVGHVAPGDKIHVIVIKPEGAGGGDNNPIVSKRKADFEQVWYGVIDKFEAGEPVVATVLSRVKGGLEVDLGVRGFVPATHVGNGKLRNIEKFVGQTLEFKIIELDRERKKVVLSNRQAEDEKRAVMKEEIFGKVKTGEVLEGTVRRLTDYGAFVDLGGIDGLLHISEMSWMRINHPKEVLKEGQEIKVMVLRLDEGTGKISLGLRQVLPDPWSLIKETYRIGQKFTCTIGRLVQSGAFIRLPEGAEAFLPVSEISTRRIAKPADVLTEGQEVEVAVLDLRPDERRMVLSLRSAGTAIEPPADYDAGSTFDEDRSSRSYGYANRGTDAGRPPASSGGGKKRGGGGGKRGRDEDGDVGFTSRPMSGGATIGERLGMLKGLLRQETDEKEEKSEKSEES